MNQADTCPKCGSDEIVPRALVIDRGDYNAQGKLQAGIEKNPDALFFKQLVPTELYASICGSCGFTELYATNPRKVYEAYRATRGGES